MPILKRKHKTTGRPFRAAYTTLRMNGLRTEGELHAFLVEEVVALLGAQRVLVVLETPAGLRIAGSLLPRNEQPQPLLNAITPWLESARSSQSSRLRHGPEAAKLKVQRSCLIAPLVAKDEVLGYLYADIEGAVWPLPRAGPRLAGDAGVPRGSNTGRDPPSRRAGAQAGRTLGRTGGDQQHPAGHGRIVGFPRDRRAGRRQTAHSVRQRQPEHHLVGRAIRDGADALRCAAWRARPGGAAQTRSDRPIHAGLVRQSPGAGQQPCRDGRLGHAPTRRFGAEPGHSDGADLCQRQDGRGDHARQPRAGAPVRRGRPALAADGGGDHGHRAGERPAVRRNQRGAGAADGDLGSASRHQQFPERPRARLSHDTREHHPALRIAYCGAVPL